MANLVNIVHPSTFKRLGDSIVVGPIEKFRERDEKICNFINRALGLGVKVIHHRDEPKNTLQGAVRDTNFIFDPSFKFFKDKRIISITTTIYGVPIVDEKPTELNEKQWQYLADNYISKSQMKKLVGKPSKVFYIGGIFEYCLVNAMGFHHKYFRKNGETIYYIPEFCVSINNKRKRVMEGKLREYDINPVSYEESLQLLSR